MKKITWLWWGCSVVDDDILMSWYFISHIAVYTTLTWLVWKWETTKQVDEARIFVFIFICCTALLPTIVLIKDLSCLFIELPFICTMFFALQHFLRLLSRESRQAILYLVIFLLEAMYFVTGWMSGWKCTLPLMLLQYRLVEKSVRRRFVPYHN